MHHVENEYAFQVLSGFDENFIIMSNDNFKSVIYQRMSEDSMDRFSKDDSGSRNICREVTWKIYDTVALQVITN